MHELRNAPAVHRPLRPAVAAAFASDSPGLGVAVLVLGPVALLLYLCLIRMTLEFYLAVTRMSQDIHHRLR